MATLHSYKSHCLSCGARDLEIPRSIKFKPICGFCGSDRLKKSISGVKDDHENIPHCWRVEKGTLALICDWDGWQPYRFEKSMTFYEASKGGPFALNFIHGDTIIQVPEHKCEKIFDAEGESK